MLSFPEEKVSIIWTRRLNKVSRTNRLEWDAMEQAKK